jgi:hypothetical protein
MFINHQQDDWADWIPMAEFTYNNNVNESNRYSPFYLNKGRHPCMFPMDELADSTTPTKHYIETICEVSRKAKECLLKSKNE